MAKSINIGNAFAECVPFLFQKYRCILEVFRSNSSRSLFTLYVVRLKCSFSEQGIMYYKFRNAKLSGLFFPIWHALKTKVTCKFAVSGIYASREARSFSCMYVYYEIYVSISPCAHARIETLGLKAAFFYTFSSARLLQPPPNFTCPRGLCSHTSVFD